MITDMNNKPSSTACERNKAPILKHLQHWLKSKDTVLEIGSGTGQHGVFFASQLPHITWQCSEQIASLPGLQQWITDAHLKNLPMPLALDVNSYAWGAAQYQTVFSANTLHIMSWPTVQHFLEHVCQALLPTGTLILYGPFRYQGAYTSESNADFDQYLRARDPESGIRDFEEIETMLQANGFVLIEDQAMPSNNQLLLWQLSTSQ